MYNPMIPKKHKVELCVLALSVMVLAAVFCDFIFDKAFEAEAIESVDGLMVEKIVSDTETATTEPVLARENTAVAHKLTESEAAVNSEKVSDDVSDNASEDTSKESAYTISVYENDLTLYTNDRVNIRTGAGTEYDKLLTLSRGAAVDVTGETTNGWYQAFYKGNVGYIKSDYLGEKVPATSFVFAGDSRTVQMSQAVKKSQYTWIAQVGEGYDYFVNTAIPQIDASVGDGTVVIINYGVNDLHNVDKYISKVNSKIDSWIAAGATVYYAAVLPVSNYPTITNADIENFNNTLHNGLDSRIGWLDGYSYLQTNGFNTADGLHFDFDTYRNLYSYYMSKIA